MMLLLLRNLTQLFNQLVLECKGVRVYMFVCVRCSEVKGFFYK